eukprot:3016579-Pleurochrysis_carterae.AAC.3
MATGGNENLGKRTRSLRGQRWRREGRDRKGIREKQRRGTQIERTSQRSQESQITRVKDHTSHRSHESTITRVTDHTSQRSHESTITR